METEKSRISRFTIGRLYNMGNYEHVRYELQLDIAPGESVRTAFENACDILRELNPKPPKSAYEYQQAKRVLEKPAHELTSYELASIDDYRKTVRLWDEWSAQRAKVHEKLDAIGATRVHTDAKDQWDDRHDDY